MFVEMINHSTPTVQRDFLRLRTGTVVIPTARKAA